MRFMAGALAALLCAAAPALPASAEASGLISGGAQTGTVDSPLWPGGCDILADAGVVMDAATGTVLYGKNIHATYYPASTTKVLTALIVLEHASLDDTVTFSYSAVHDVEDNSSSAGYDTGDTATVETLLYALLLKSANEAANALAEHVAGTTQAFAEMMNEKAKELGCVDSHFNNPSGLNDPEHYVSAYDMALIIRAALENDEFAKIVATPYYELPPNSRYPEGQGISPGNKMIKSNWPQYRKDVIGGKTGYTSMAMNTLVNGAREGDFTVVTAVLHADNTQYEDTSRMMDFAFANFESVRAADQKTGLTEIEDDLSFGGYRPGSSIVPSMDPDSRLVVPKNISADDINVTLDYDVPDGAPAGTAAVARYSVGGVEVGHAYMTLTAGSDRDVADPNRAEAVAAVLGETGAAAEDHSGEAAEPSGKNESLLASAAAEESKGAESAGVSAAASVPDVKDILRAIRDRIPEKAVLAGGILLLAVLAVNLVIRLRHLRRAREMDDAEQRRQRREVRLRDAGVSREEFERIRDRLRESAKRRRDAGETAGSEGAADAPEDSSDSEK